MDYISKYNSKYLILYHVILVCKYKDYIHILINSNPNVTISFIVKFIKQVTTNLLWK